MRRMLAPIVVLVLVLAVPSFGGAATKEVTISPNGTSFDPSTVRVTAGGDVHWSKSAGALSHNVREDGELFRSGDPTNGAIDFSVTFSAGKFHYYCEIHGSASGGMSGFVKVPVKFKGAPGGAPFTVTWAPGGSETGSSYDVQYRIGAGVWMKWKRNTATGSGVFGKNGDPETAQNGTAYQFRARSGDGSAKSGWSPKASFTP
ncbi:MAG TPA: hypothetical protein VGB51_03435 [Actinomycetota bacterium]